MKITKTLTTFIHKLICTKLTKLYNSTVTSSLPLNARSIIFTANAINGQQLSQMSAPLKNKCKHNIRANYNIMIYYMII